MNWNFFFFCRGAPFFFAFCLLQFLLSSIFSVAHHTKPSIYVPSEQFPYRWPWNDPHPHMHTSEEEERYLKSLGGGWVSLSLTHPHLTPFPSSQCPFNVCRFFFFFLKKSLVSLAYSCCLSTLAFTHWDTLR